MFTCDKGIILTSAQLSPLAGFDTVLINATHARESWLRNQCSFSHRVALKLKSTGMSQSQCIEAVNCISSSSRKFGKGNDTCACLHNQQLIMMRMDTAMHMAASCTAAAAAAFGSQSLTGSKEIYACTGCQRPM